MAVKNGSLLIKVKLVIDYESVITSIDNWLLILDQLSIKSRNLFLCFLPSQDQPWISS